VAKKADKANPQEKARRALVKAQLKLEVAQQEHTQERVRGQQEVEKARLRAQKWLAKAAQRVERRAEVVAQAEAALAAQTNPPREAAKAPEVKKQPVRRKRTASTTTAASPEAAADRVKEAQAAHAEPPDPVIVSQTIPSMKDSARPPRKTGPDSK